VLNEKPGEILYPNSYHAWKSTAPDVSDIAGSFIPGDIAILLGDAFGYYYILCKFGCCYINASCYNNSQ
jgi:hypothetical protein